MIVGAGLYRSLLVLALIVTGAIAIAETPISTSAPTPPTAPATQACELHVWPSSSVGADERGLITGGGILFQSKRNSIDSGVLYNALDRATQLGIVTAGDLPERLGIPAATVVPHELLSLSDVNKVGKGRFSSSNASCYYELFVSRIVAFKSTLFDELRVTYSLYDFNRPKARLYQRITTAPLKLFPPKPGEDVLAANDELVSAFKTSFEKFATEAKTRNDKIVHGE